MQLGAGEDGIFGPERRAAGDPIDEREMEGKISEVVGREDLDRIAIAKNQPEKCAKREEPECDRDERAPGAEPKRTACCVAECGGGACDAGGQRKESQEPVQPPGGKRKERGCDCGDGGSNEERDTTAMAHRRG